MVPIEPAAIGREPSVPAAPELDDAQDIPTTVRKVPSSEVQITVWLQSCCWVRSDSK